jgi:hypothetical protein
MAGRPPRPTTPPHGAMQRGRRRRGKSGGPPRPREQIRLPQEPVSADKLPRQIRLGCIEPFPSRPDKTLPGTLHHSGNRPAPPSDHIPLARHSAFQRGWCGNSDARPGLERIQPENFDVPGGNSPADGKWNFVVPLPLLRRSSSGNFDLDQVGKDRGEVRPCRACFALRIDRELTYATRRRRPD